MNPLVIVQLLMCHTYVTVFIMKQVMTDSALLDSNFTF